MDFLRGLRIFAMLAESMFTPTKKDLQQPVTVGDFVEFADFIIENVATKTDLERFAAKGDVRSELAQCATKEDVTSFKDEILTGHDKVIKKLDQVLTEQAAISGNLDQYRDEVKEVRGLVKRVERLEAHSGVA